MELSPGSGGGSGSPLTVTDGVTPVVNVTTINFTSGATVSNGGGGTALVAIAAGGVTVFNDTVTGTINGSNTVFTVANTITGAISLYLANSIYQNTVDYTVTGVKQITYTVAPDASLAGQPHFLAHT
jgi:hypothetical protein